MQYETDDPEYWAAELHEYGQDTEGSLDKQDFVKRNRVPPFKVVGQHGVLGELPKNEFLTLNNVKYLIRMFNLVTPRSQHSRNDQIVPRDAKQWWDHSTYKQMLGAANLQEINYDFLMYLAQTIHPVFFKQAVQIWERELGEPEIRRDIREREKFVATTRGHVKGRQYRSVDDMPTFELGEDMGSDYTSYDYGMYAQQRQPVDLNGGSDRGSVDYQSQWDDGNYLENVLARGINAFNTDIPSDVKDISAYRFDKFQRGKKKMYRIDNQHKRLHESNIDDTLRQPYEVEVQQRHQGGSSRDFYNRFNNPDDYEEYNPQSQHGKKRLNWMKIPF